MLRAIVATDERTGPIVSGYSRAWEIRRGLTNLTSIVAVTVLALAGLMHPYAAAGCIVLIAAPTHAGQILRLLQRNRR